MERMELARPREQGIAPGQVFKRQRRTLIRVAPAARRNAGAPHAVARLAWRLQRREPQSGPSLASARSRLHARTLASPTNGRMPADQTSGKEAATRPALPLAWQHAAASRRCGVPGRDQAEEPRVPRLRRADERSLATRAGRVRDRKCPTSMHVSVSTASGSHPIVAADRANDGVSVTWRWDAQTRSRDNSCTPQYSHWVKISVCPPSLRASRAGCARAAS